MANKIEKEKGLLIALSVFALLLTVGGLVGGILIISNGVNALSDNMMSGIVSIIGGAIMILFGGALGVFGIRYLFVGLALKATKGSVAETNLSKGTVNGKTCPKCGCTNTPDSKVCTSCGEKLD